MLSFLFNKLFILIISKHFHNLLFLRCDNLNARVNNAFLMSLIVRKELGQIKIFLEVSENYM